MEDKQSPECPNPTHAPEIIALLRGTRFLVAGFERLQFSHVAEVLSSVGAIAVQGSGQALTSETWHALIASVPALIDLQPGGDRVPPLLIVGTPWEIAMNVVGYAMTGVDFLAIPWTPPELIARVFRLLTSSPRAQAKLHEKMERPQILIADDDPDIANLLKSSLRSHADCQVVGNGLATLRVIRQSPPDVLILDVNMPVLGGFDVLKTIRDDPGLRRLPVILLTASDDVADIRRGVELGADDYIVKPFGVNTLIQRLRDVLNGVGRATPGHHNNSYGNRYPYVDPALLRWVLAK